MQISCAMAVALRSGGIYVNLSAAGPGQWWSLCVEIVWDPNRYPMPCALCLAGHRSLVRLVLKHLDMFLVF